MHMADALLSPAVGTAMCAVSAGAIAYSAAKLKKDELCDKKVPVMAVTGAFLFAAQMVNFTIPATGSSGHIGGGVLLAGLLGGFPALLTISAVLIIQCLFFADGGLLALGCNIFNLGVIPCLLICPLLFRPILIKGLSVRRITVASIVSVVAGLQLGSFSVVLETFFSGISSLPFGTFLLLMQPIHFAIGIVEGIVTASILCFVFKARPEIMESAHAGRAIAAGISVKKVLIAFCVLAAVAGGALSTVASAYPDGLEWSLEKISGTALSETEGAIYGSVAAIRERTAFLPDYDYKNTGENGSETGSAVSGIVGSAMTFAFAGAAGFIISKAKKSKKNKAADAV